MIPGIHDATIIKNGISATRTGTPYAFVRCGVDGEEVPCTIWLTDKAMGMARAALRKCGFDVDTEDLDELRANPQLLAGNKVQIEVEDKEKYGLQGSIVLGSIPKSRISELTKKLRDAKRNGHDEDPVPAASDDSGIPF